MMGFLNEAVQYGISDAALRASDVDGDGYYTKEDARLMRAIGMGEEVSINQDR